MLYFLTALDMAMRFLALRSMLLSASVKNLNCGWLLSTLLVPVLGPIAFYTFHRRSSLVYDTSDFEDFLRELEKEEANHHATSKQPQDGKWLKMSNKPDLLAGPEFIEALERRINNARESIFICTFVYLLSNNKISAALKSAKERNVDITLIIDMIGSSAISGYMKYRKLKKELGPDVFLFGADINKINFRLHSKIAFFDGEYAIIGSHNIDQLSMSTAPADKRANYSIGTSGEILLCFAKYCSLLRYYVTKQKKYFIAKPSSIQTGPNEGRSRAMFAYNGLNYQLDLMKDLLSSGINEAKKSIKICNPYVMCPYPIMDLMSLAIKRGVQIDICAPSPEHQDIMTGRNITPLYIRDYISSGCNFHSINHFVHSKFMIIDDKELRIGSQNLDFRSMNINHETILITDDSDLIAQMDKAFEAIKAQSRLYKGFSNSFRIPTLQLIKSNLIASVLKNEA